MIFPIGTLATIKGIPFKQHEFKLNPGDSFFVYTDGVVEASNESKELYGSSRMLNALNQNPDAQPEQILANVSQDINAFVDGAEQFDDITMLCFRYFGPSEDAS